MVKSYQPSDVLADFYKKLSKYAPLKHEEFITLLKEYRVTNDRKLYEKLVNHNLRLAFRYIKKYTGTNVNSEDLLQSACMGLLKALDKYDPDSGYKFSTYATWWFMSYVHKSFAYEARNVKIPLTSQSKIYKITTAMEILNITDPSNDYEEISRITELPIDTIKGLQEVQSLVFMDSIEESKETSKGHAYEHCQPYTIDNNDSQDSYMCTILWEVLKPYGPSVIAIIDKKTDFIDYLLSIKDIEDSTDILEVKKEIETIGRINNRLNNETLWSMYCKFIRYNHLLYFLLLTKTVKNYNALSWLYDYYSQDNKANQLALGFFTIIIGKPESLSVSILLQYESLYKHLNRLYRKRRTISLL